MTDCSIRWRPSGGRGEYEFVPAHSLEGKAVLLSLDALDVTIPAEVRGVNEAGQGKPRLRKFEASNRTKLHLPPLVTALARLPEPRREDTGQAVIFPLENKGYLLNELEFDISEDDGENVTLVPLRMSILNSDWKIDLQDRFAAVAADWAQIDHIARRDAPLANAILAHRSAVLTATNSSALRETSDEVIRLQTEAFGATNFGSVTSLITATEDVQESVEADIYVGVEGRTLIRVHAYKERDRTLSRKAKKHYKRQWGELRCEVCSFRPSTLYGHRGDSCIEAHHRTPIAQLLPDSVTTVEDLAMLCASCHRVVHSEAPIVPLQSVLHSQTNH